jgi:hypothetical protein
LYARADPLTRGEVRQQDVWRLNSQAGVFAGDHSSDGEFNVQLDGEQGEANAGGRAGCKRTRSAAQVAAAGGAVRQGGRAGAGVEREAEARPVA